MDSRNVLVVGAQPAVRDGCRMALMKQGYKVALCQTGKEGMLAALAGSYEIVILDLELPDIDGMEVLETILKEKPQTGIIMVSGNASLQIGVQAMKLGAFDYISSPFTDDELILSVEQATKKSHLVEQDFASGAQPADLPQSTIIIGKNHKIIEALDIVRKVAPTDCAVLINGENGTGKELFARVIHSASQRSGHFVAIDCCCAFSSNSMGSELLGHSRDDPAGAAPEKRTILESAANGTLFLDNVADLSPDSQAKLLRALEACEYKPEGTGGSKTAARLISAANRDIRKLVQTGSFREDLYYRLSVSPIFLPPLRERRDDIPLLANHYLNYYCSKTGKYIEEFTKEAMETLVSFEWPGNVRQFRSLIEHLVVMSDRLTIDVPDLLESLYAKSWGETSVPKTRRELIEVKRRILEQTFGWFERMFLIRALEECNWNITSEARQVGMMRPNFSALMRKHKINRKSGEENKADKVESAEDCLDQVMSPQNNLVKKTGK